jgi:hypothetical protein
MGGLTIDYIEQSLIPASLCSEGLSGLCALGTLFSLLAIGALFATPGPGEAPEVHLFAQVSTWAISALSPIGSPSLELIEALYAWAIREMLRQGQQEETARSVLAMACRMCYDVRNAFIVEGIA